MIIIDVIKLEIVYAALLLLSVRIPRSYPQVESTHLDTEPAARSYTGGGHAAYEIHASRHALWNT